jgi:hypothetical protein
MLPPGAAILDAAPGGRRAWKTFMRLPSGEHTGKLVLKIA